MAPRVHVIGVGSPHGGDSIGWRVLERLRDMARTADWKDQVRLSVLDRPGVRLVEHWRDAESVIVVDAMVSGARPGSVRRLEGAELRALDAQWSSHGLGVADAVALAAALGSLPPRLVVFGSELPPEATPTGAAVSAAAHAVVQEVAKLLASG
jgi:hydrogenase maturation protease